MQKTGNFIQKNYSADLVYRVALAVSIEARGVFNEASKRKDYGDMKGIIIY